MSDLEVFIPDKVQLQVEGADLAKVSSDCLQALSRVLQLMSDNKPNKLKT